MRALIARNKTPGKLSDGHIRSVTPLITRFPPFSGGSPELLSDGQESVFKRIA
jgi:hypothetical protein